MTKRVCQIRSINQSNCTISVRLLFPFCSRVFISRSYENRSICYGTSDWISCDWQHHSFEFVSEKCVSKALFQTSQTNKLWKTVKKICPSLPPFVLPVLFITLFWHFERLCSCFNHFFGSSQGLNFRYTAHLDKPWVSYSIQQRPVGTGLAGKTHTVTHIKIIHIPKKSNIHLISVFLPDEVKLKVCFHARRRS